MRKDSQKTNFQEIDHIVRKILEMILEILYNQCGLKGH